MMLTPRIHVDAGIFADADCVLAAGASRHVAQVLRMRIGDPLALFTGQGGEFEAEIARIERSQVVVRVLRHLPIERESAWPVTLVQAIVAADMMDIVVRKAVELGAAGIVVFPALRSQRIPAERTARRLAHWRSIAIAACEQCGRNRVPDVVATPSLVASLRGVADPLAVLDAAAPESLASLAHGAPPRAIVAGPEGGLVDDEVLTACARGARRAHLGRRVLRAETAALAALATLNAIAGDAR